MREGNIDSVIRAAQSKLKEPRTQLPEKYRILFLLRGASSASAHAALVEGTESVYMYTSSFRQIHKKKQTACRRA